MACLNPPRTARYAHCVHCAPLRTPEEGDRSEFSGKKKGDSVPLTLKLEGKDKKLSTLEIKAEVRELTAPPMMDHKH